MITIKNFLCMMCVIFSAFDMLLIKAGNKNFKAQTIEESQLIGAKSDNKKSKRSVMLFGGMFFGSHAGRLIPAESYRQQQHIQEISEQKIRELSESKES